MIMPVNEGISLRAAHPEDGPALARLMNEAGEGLPAWLWSQNAEPGQDVMAYGASRASSDEGAFSYRNAHVVVSGGEVAGILLGYRLPDPYPDDALDQCPDVVKPLIELESLSPGAWYVNAVAVAESRRGHGLGSRLMNLAEQLARQAGSGRICLIVAEGNDGATRLYRRLGYGTAARRDMVPYPECPHEGGWLLMQKPLN